MLPLGEITCISYLVKFIYSLCYHLTTNQLSDIPFYCSCYKDPYKDLEEPDLVMRLKKITQLNSVFSFNKPGLQYGFLSTLVFQQMAFYSPLESTVQQESVLFSFYNNLLFCPVSYTSLITIIYAQHQCQGIMLQYLGHLPELSFSKVLLTGGSWQMIH